jgi:hypothetical protein
LRAFRIVHCRPWFLEFKSYALAEGKPDEGWIIRRQRPEWGALRNF